MDKIKIVIAGIGGVGGYFGGLLAKYYRDKDNVDVYFIARGEHLKEIQLNGLKVIDRQGEFIAKPVLATDHPAEIGIADIVIISTKSYDLESLLQQIRPCINKDTILLPLLNGVDSKEKIEKIFPENMVLDGCVYIISRLKQPGIIENSGNIQTLYFGLDNYEDEKLNQLEGLFGFAGIEAKLSMDISKIIWEKFVFLSPTATVTSYFDKNIGEVLSDKECLETLSVLIEEVKALAKVKKVFLTEDITERTMIKLKSLPFETTTSMHSDFKNKKQKTEIDSLTGFVLSEAQKYSIKTPTYLKIYEELNKKNDK